MPNHYQYVIFQEDWNKGDDYILAKIRESLPPEVEIFTIKEKILHEATRNMVLIIEPVYKKVEEAPKEKNNWPESFRDWAFW